MLGAKVFLALVGIGLVCLVVVPIVYAVKGLSASIEQSRAEEARNGSKSDALVVCERFVTNRLKSPSTAKLHHDGSIADAVSGGGTDGVYKVHGYYDAQNSFGAMLRGRYVCSVRHTVGDNYQLVDLEMTR